MQSFSLRLWSNGFPLFRQQKNTVLFKKNIRNFGLNSPKKQKDSRDASMRGDEWSIKIFNCSQSLPLLDLRAKFKRVLACSCSPNFCVARKLAKQIFYFCSCSQKKRSARHARECSQRPFVTPSTVKGCV